MSDIYEEEKQMITTWLCDCVKLITYKPGWEFTISDHGATGTLALTVISPVMTDTYFGAGVTTRLSQETAFSWSLLLSMEHEVRESFFLSSVLNLVRSVELHEMAEWLKLDGKHLVEPHGA